MYVFVNIRLPGEYSKVVPFNDIYYWKAKKFSGCGILAGGMGKHVQTKPNLSVIQREFLHLEFRKKLFMGDALGLKNMHMALVSRNIAAPTD